MTRNSTDRMQVLCGIHAVESALQSRHQSLAEIVHDGSLDNPRVAAILDRAQASGVKLHRAKKDVLNQLAGELRHQGIVGLLARAPAQNLAAFRDWLRAAPADGTILILDSLEDPRNLGSCLRSAAAAGVSAVVIPANEGAGLTPAALRVAAGGTHHLELFEVGNWSQTLNEIKEMGFWLLGASERAEQSLFDFDLRGRIAWVFGSEANGLRTLTAKHCDAFIKVPSVETFPSLNVGVATGIALFETLRQKQR